MSLDLYPQENVERLQQLRPAQTAEPGAFDGFLRGTGMLTVRGMLKTGSAVDLLGSLGPMTQDAFTGGTEAQDRYFKEHDDVYGKAIEWWSPKPDEVGMAAQVVGGLISTLPTVIASPGLAIGATQLSVAEELVKEGVDANTAQAVGAIQAGGLGLGIYMPVIGKTLAQRVATGIGSNVTQGAVTRGASEKLLEDTAAKDDFHAFDPTQLTLDTLLGAAFGSLSHLSPEQRVNSARAWKAVEDWAQRLKPSDIDALATLKQSEQLNVDSMPGKPVAPVDTERHYQRMKLAVEQLVRDEPVQVSDLPKANVEVDKTLQAEHERNSVTLLDTAEEVRKSEGLPAIESEAPAAMRATEPPPRGQRVDAAGAEVIIKPKTVAEMSVDELRTEALRDPLTGIKNRRAFEEDAAQFPVRGAVDADSLKWINDHLGHEAGDTLLRTLGHALSLETEGAYRIGGDEFAVGAKTTEEAKAILEKVTKRLQDAEIVAERPDGSKVTVKGVYFSYGIGKDFKAADADLQANKLSRERAGLRPARGHAPPGVTREPAQGKQNTRDQAAQEVTPLQREADRFAENNPDLNLRVGQNADGSPIVKTLRQYLDDANNNVEKARSEKSLYEIAAGCLLGAA
jgi:diguanylate cyclase (GGDEF)-like protein